MLKNYQSDSISIAGFGLTCAITALADRGSGQRRCTNDTMNHELRLANDYVHHTDCHIFLTGKAGTGKTTFLHSIKKSCAKALIVTAPTGVAAINAGGVTLHSFFQLPFGPFIPGSEEHEANRGRLHRFSKEKKRIIQGLDLLMIDEVSMVRADVLDAVDAVLRRQRRDNRPFGGLQLLMIGDLHQLSPVAARQEWQLLARYYESPYFFSSHALSRVELITIELKHVYRQTDEGFIRVLNCVRENRLDRSAVADLNRRYIPNFMPKEDQGYITLTTHNATADGINRSRLRALQKTERCFNAEIAGDFPEYNYPAPATLRLKEGAQVMFLRNDLSIRKRYFNGKIGRIKKISGSTILVVCPEDNDDIEVEPVEWKNIKYAVNPESKAIEEEVIGTFKQYPLKLAWAITIHKSQGLTFDKAVIDVQAAFAHGQVYVALSRCRTLDGLVLTTPVPTHGVQTDEAILHFDSQTGQNPPSESCLLAAKINYQQRLLLDCFDFERLQSRLNRLTGLLLSHTRVVRMGGPVDIARLRQTCEQTILAVGEKFKRQLHASFPEGTLPETDAYVLERIVKASAWFQEQFKLLFEDLAGNLPVETDNRELRRKVKNAIEDLQNEIAVKLAGIRACENGFSPAGYLRAVATAAMDVMAGKPSKRRTSQDYTAKGIEHPELFQDLKNWRTRKAREEGVAPFHIVHQRVLIQIADFLPNNTADLGAIKGIGKKTIAKYGQELISLTAAYRNKHGIQRMTPATPGSGSKQDSRTDKNLAVSDSKQISFDLFNKGMTIDHIAQERGLALSTIEGHLCFFVERGQLDISKVLTAEKQRVIEKQLGTANSLSQIKHALGDGYSYGEIRLVLAHRKHQAQK